jgi:hypothetical protein
VANALAYYDTATITAVKSFPTPTPGANVIKLFTVVSYVFYNKLERLSLASLSRLVLYVCGLVQEPTLEWSNYKVLHLGRLLP